MIAGLSSGRALLWVAAATAAGALVLACDRLPAGCGALVALAGRARPACWRRSSCRGSTSSCCKPRNWGELVEGVAGGAQSLGTVRMPYDGADPWPRAALELGGSLLLDRGRAARVLAARRRARRGYPFLALVALLVLVVSPVVSLGGTRPLLLGAAIAALTVCFLWLERLPLRPGHRRRRAARRGAGGRAAAGRRRRPRRAVVRLQGVRRGARAGRPGPLQLEPDYGPIDWPRDGNEVMRVTSDEPHYWKAANLSSVRRDGLERAGRGRPPGRDVEDELREDWRNKPGWQDRIEVSVRRMRTLDVAGARHDHGDRERDAAGAPVRRARPLDGELGAAPRRLLHGRGLRPGADGGRGAPGRPHGLPRLARRPARDHRPVPAWSGSRPCARSAAWPTGAIDAAVVHFRPFGDDDGRLRHLSRRSGARATTRSTARSAARRTRARGSWPSSSAPTAETPFEYILLRQQPTCRRRVRLLRAAAGSRAPGRAPLDAFLIDTKEGYCQHFSGAMALLLRMGGIPARVATGFSPGGFSKRRNAWIVRDTDAHAWVEAWYDELGWVTYDPTPDATPARSQIAALEAAPAPIPASPAADDADGRRRRVRRAQPGVLRPEPALRPAAQQPGRGAGRGAGRRASPGGRGRWPALARACSWPSRCVPLAPRGAAAAAPCHRSTARSPSSRPRCAAPAGRCRPGTTLRQLEQRLGASPDATAYLRALSASRYGPAPEPPTAAQRRALRRALAQGLGPAGRLRAFWALPPRPR